MKLDLGWKNGICQECGKKIIKENLGQLYCPAPKACRALAREKVIKKYNEKQRNKIKSVKKI